jgi:hypothetical protein
MATTEFAPYTVLTAFIINMGEASSKQSFKVSPGDVIEFDGMNVLFNGVTGPAPTLRAALREGWISLAPKTTKSKVSRRDASETGIFAQPQAKAGKAQVPNGLESFDIEKLGQKMPPATKVAHSSSPEVSVTTRAGKASANTASVQASSPTPTRGYTVEKEEARSVASVRATSGAASPMKAELLKKASVEVQKTAPVKAASKASVPAKKPTSLTTAQTVSAFKAPERKRLSIVAGDDAEASQASRRADAAKFEERTLVDDASGAGKGEGEYVEMRAKKSGSASAESSDPGVPNPASARIRLKKEEPQVVDAVYKGRRATPAVTDISASELLSATGKEEPKAIRKEASMQRIDTDGEGNRTFPTRAIKEGASDGIISSKVSVSGNALKDPTVTFGGSSESIIMGKQASFVKSNDSIYDPDNALGLQSNDLIQKKAVSVIGPDAAEPEEEDYSALNATDEDEAILAAALAPPPPPSADTTEVAPDYLDRLVVEGSTWDEAKFYTRVKYISKCTNLSILALISGTKLQPSVRKVLEDRLAVLTPSAKPEKAKPAAKKK